MVANRVKRIDSERSIAQQIEADGNRFQCVCLSSKIDGFSNGRNAGNTLYNLYRTPAVRAARVPGRIWHWVPVAGHYWMGLVMVDSPGAVETVTVKLRDREIAPVVAGLGDDRRHLYYWPAPFDFEFAETLEILTPADEAPYVIEGFVFMAEEPTDEPFEVSTSPEVLAAPALTPTMLPEEIRIENPRALSGPQVIDLTLALPGVDAVTAMLDGVACPTVLRPLTRAPDGAAVNQQLQILANLPAAPESTVSLHLGDSPQPPVCAAEVTATDEGLHIDGVGIVRPTMPGATLTLQEQAGWGNRDTLRPAFVATWRLISTTVELEISLTARFALGTPGVEIEHDLLITGPDDMVTIPSLALEVQTARGSDRHSVFVTGPNVNYPPLIHNGCLTLAAADFAVFYPAGLEVDGRILTWHLLPAGFEPPELPRRERDKRFFHVTVEGYRFKRGLRRRHRCFLSPDREPALAWLDPPHPVLTRDLCRGLVMPAPTPPEPRQWRTRTLEAWQRQQRELHAFGLPNYGDWFGERCCNWGNGEYDSSYGLLLQYLHTADSAWATLGIAAARHLLEVDTAHLHPQHPHWQYPHCMGHTGGYFPNSYEVGAYGESPNPGVAHSWVEGVLLYYLLTGDHLALATARAFLDDLSGPVLATKYFSNGRDMGWHLVHLVAGATVLREPRYLAAADRLVQLILERQRPDGSWRRVLDSDHCTCYPRHTGNTAFMVGVLLEGLVGYHQLSGDDRVADAICRAGHFLWRDIRDPATGKWRYTSCPNSRIGAPGGSEIHWLAPMMYSVRRGDVDAATGAAWKADIDRFLAAYCDHLAAPPVPERGKEAPGKQMSKSLRLMPKVADRQGGEFSTGD